MNPVEVNNTKASLTKLATGTFANSLVGLPAHLRVFRARRTATFFFSFALLLIFVCTAIYISNHQLQSTNHDPLSHNLPILGLTVLSLWLLYAGIKILSESLDLNFETVAAKSLLASQALKLSEIVGIANNVQAARAPSAIIYVSQTILTDVSGKSLTIPVHKYENDKLIAEFLLELAVKNNISLNSDTDTMLRELAGAASANAFVNVASDRAMRRQLKATVIGGPIFMLIALGLIIGWGLWVHQGIVNRKDVPVDITTASPIAAEYLHYIGDGNVANATLLEDSSLQQDDAIAKYIHEPASHVLATAQEVSLQPVKNPATHTTYAVAIYTYPDNGQSAYVKLVLRPYGDTWRVHTVQTSPGLPNGSL